MEKDMIVTLEDDDKYYLVEEIMQNDNKYFIADKVDENKKRLNEPCIFKEIHEGDKIYLEVEEDASVIKQIKESI